MTIPDVSKAPSFLEHRFDIEIRDLASPSDPPITAVTAGGPFRVNAVEHSGATSRDPGPFACWVIYQPDADPRDRPFVITIDPADDPHRTHPNPWSEFNWNTDGAPGGTHHLFYFELDVPRPSPGGVEVDPAYLETLSEFARDARNAAAASAARAAARAASSRRASANSDPTPAEDLDALADALEQLRDSLESVAATISVAEPELAGDEESGAAALVRLFELLTASAGVRRFLSRRATTAPTPNKLAVFGGTGVAVTATPSTQPEPQLVSLQRSAIELTDDVLLWTVIRNRTNAIGNAPYTAFIDSVLCGDGGTEGLDRRRREIVRDRGALYRGGEAYDIVRAATELFLLHETGVLNPDEMLDDLDRASRTGGGTPSATPSYSVRGPGRLVSRTQLQAMRRDYYLQLAQVSGPVLPYFQHILDRLTDIPFKDEIEVNGTCYGILKSRVTGPLAMELWWAYWHEEAGIVQSMNTILARFQNRRLRPGPDPLMRFELDPLRPLNNLLWGWVQDELSRLTLRRRSLEYEHEYGVRLIGRAVPGTEPVDRRSKFLEAFHNLIYLTHIFYRQDDDTTVVADAFPLLNALRETHLLLAEGAHNQFGDMPWLARAEMLVMEWLLARPEMRAFLGGRVMVPYEEPWMDRVDTMRAIQGWGDTNVTHFRDLGVFGEQLLLSIRYGDWNSILDPDNAGNWARFWRSEIQRYAHAYRAATGVDLVEQPDATLPAILLQQRTGAPALAGRQAQAVAAGARWPAVEGQARTPSLAAPRPGQRQALPPAQQRQA
jgi:hypothetical protein